MGREEMLMYLLSNQCIWKFFWVPRHHHLFLLRFRNHLFVFSIVKYIVAGKFHISCHKKQVSVLLVLSAMAFWKLFCGNGDLLPSVLQYSSAHAGYIISWGCTILPKAREYCLPVTLKGGTALLVMTTHTSVKECRENVNGNVFWSC